MPPNYISGKKRGFRGKINHSNKTLVSMNVNMYLENTVFIVSKQIIKLWIKYSHTRYKNVR